MLLEANRSTILTLAYLVGAVFITALTLSIYAPYLQQFISIQYSFYFELAMVLGQLIFQSVFIFSKSFATKYLYVFHLLTVSLLGSLLLWVAIGLKQIIVLGSGVLLCYFLFVVVFMFFEHRRRLKQLKLPLYLSYTWLLYRSAILIFIL